eukprot:2290194-Rhodomonas_salina.1
MRIWLVLTACGGAMPGTNFAYGPTRWNRHAETHCGIKCLNNHAPVQCVPERRQIAIDLAHPHALSAVLSPSLKIAAKINSQTRRLPYRRRWLSRVRCGVRPGELRYLLRGSLLSATLVSGTDAA